MGVDAEHDRRVRGAWATPTWLVEHVLDLALEPVLAARPSPSGLRVLDPACGDGRFLVAAGERIARRFGRTPGEVADALLGVEVHGPTAAAARARLGEAATVIHGDALVLDLPGVDVVVGNPPFLNQLARATSRGGRSPLGGGTYADTAVEFLALALRLTQPGGRIGLVLPQSVLASRDAAPVRSRAAELAALVGLWWSAGERTFDAAVNTVVVSLHRGAPQGAVHRWVGEARTPLPPIAQPDLAHRPTWSHLLADAAAIPPLGPLATDGHVGDRARATAGFRDQFYGLAPVVEDGLVEAPLVTAGLLDPGGMAWGERPARFAGRRYERPGVDLTALARRDERLAAWVSARRVPKVLLATQTTVLEAAVDADGTWVPSVPVISVEPHPGQDLWALGAVLSSPVTSAWAAGTYLGAGLGPTTIKLSAAQVLGLPWPAGDLAPAARRLRQGDLLAAGEATLAAYGLDADAGREVLTWWAEAVSAARRRSARASGCSPRRGR